MSPIGTIVVVAVVFCSYMTVAGMVRRVVEAGGRDEGDAIFVGLLWPLTGPFMLGSSGARWIARRRERWRTEAEDRKLEERLEKEAREAKAAGQEPYR